MKPQSIVDWPHGFRHEGNAVVLDAARVQYSNRQAPGWGASIADASHLVGHDLSMFMDVEIVPWPPGIVSPSNNALIGTWDMDSNAVLHGMQLRRLGLSQWLVAGGMNDSTDDQCQTHSSIHGGNPQDEVCNVGGKADHDVSVGVHRVGFSWNSVSGEYIVYVDGVPVGRHIYATPPCISDGVLELWVGSDPRHFDAASIEVGRLAVYDRVLTPEEEDEDMTDIVQQPKVNLLSGELATARLQVFDQFGDLMTPEEVEDALPADQAFSAVSDDAAIIALPDDATHQKRVITRDGTVTVQAKVLSGPAPEETNVSFVLRNENGNGQIVANSEGNNLATLQLVRVEQPRIEGVGAITF